MAAIDTVEPHGSFSLEPKPWTAGDPVLDLDEIRGLELKLEEEGTSLFELMHRAGVSVAAEVKKQYGSGTRALMLCGNGNNGGDAWVVAADLARAGFRVGIVAASAPEEIHAEPARSTAIRAIEELTDSATNVAVHILPDQTLLESLMADAGIVIDGILGTGFSGDSVREPFATWITIANTCRASNADLKTFSIDIPSGLSGQTGFAANPTVQADCTITMLAMKPGLLTDTAKPYCGTLLCAHIVDVTGDAGKE